MSLDDYVEGDNDDAFTIPMRGNEFRALPGARDGHTGGVYDPHEG